jgi:hypothetical protein
MGSMDVGVKLVTIDETDGADRNRRSPANFAERRCSAPVFSPKRFVVATLQQLGPTIPPGHGIDACG